MFIHSMIDILLILLFLPILTRSFNWFHRHHYNFNERTISDECCVPSKFNVASKKANNGREFFHRLSNNDDSYKEINPENMCNFIHFLIQQASLNNQSISFTKGMFVLFDSTNQIFNKFMRAKNEQKSGDEAKYSGYFNRLKHMTEQAISELFEKGPKESDIFIYVRGDESSHYHNERGSKYDRTHEYSAYGMDIPGACMPSGFGHILFGKLPSLKSSGKYAGERIYFKPELFGIRHLEHFIQHVRSYLEHISRRYICQIKEIEQLSDCSSDQAFRENTDEKLLKQWQEILQTIPNIDHLELIENAKQYGIHEIYRQAKNLEDNNRIKDFLMKIIEQYGNDDIIVRKGREIIYTVKQLNQSPLTCEIRINTKDCCNSPKINIHSEKANAGKDLLQRLIIPADIYEDVTPEKMCHFIHFLFQQASINKKSIDFTDGMFVIFDSSNQLFHRLIKTKTQRLVTKAMNIYRYLREKHFNKNIPQLAEQSYENSDERFPTFGMDIPNSCLPNNFDHILLGELPMFNYPKKYVGRRFFLKPERFGFEKRKISSVMKDFTGFVKQFVRQKMCRLIKGETTAECAKLRAFKQNIDKDIYKKWKKILLGLSSKWKIDQSYKQRAFKYGIHEINQQANDLQVAGAGRKVEKFRKYLRKKYGSEDIVVRKGQEIIFTIEDLQNSHRTCQSSSDTKCSSSLFKSFF